MEKIVLKINHNCVLKRQKLFDIKFHDFLIKISTLHKKIMANLCLIEVCKRLMKLAYFRTNWF